MNMFEVGAAPGKDAASSQAAGPGGHGALVAECQRIFYNTDLEPLFAGLAGNPFQSHMVISCWMATFSGRGDAGECYLITLRDAQGTVVFALPLTRRKVAGVTRIELPHSGVIDFTTPFMRDSFAVNPPSPSETWSLIRAALPPADIVIFRRLAKGGDTFDNPLFALPQARPSRSISLRVAPLLGAEERYAELAKAFRKRLRQNTKKFLELPGARFVAAKTPEEALDILVWMEARQGERIRGKGLDYGLDCPRVKDFYRRLIKSGVENGSTLVFCMKSEDEILAASFSILSDRVSVFLRVASNLSVHAALTPGLLVTDATMNEAHARGITQFDFGMGDYHYKRQLGGQPNPLCDLMIPLNNKGAALAALMRARQWAAGNPIIRRLSGRKALPQG